MQGWGRVSLLCSAGYQGQGPPVPSSRMVLVVLSDRTTVSRFKNNKYVAWLGGSQLECRPVHQKVVGSIPSQGPYRR